MTKTTTVISALALGLMMSSAAFAQSSIVKDSDIDVKSTNKGGVLTKSEGVASIANTGGVTLKKSDVTNGSFIGVGSDNDSAITKSEGFRTIATTGGVVVRNSEVKNSAITVGSKNKDATTKAIGKHSSANTGGTVIQ